MDINLIYPPIKLAYLMAKKVILMLTNLIGSWEKVMITNEWLWLA